MRASWRTHLDGGRHVRKAALQMMDYDRIVVPNSSRPHAATCIRKQGRAAELPHLLGLRCPHAREDLREHTSNLNSTLCPTFDSAHLDGLALGPVFRVPPAEGRHDDQRTAPGAARRHNFLRSASSYDPTDPIENAYT